MVITTDNALEYMASRGEKNVEYTAQALAERIELASCTIPANYSLAFSFLMGAGRMQKDGRVLIERYHKA